MGIETDTTCVLQTASLLTAMEQGITWSHPYGVRFLRARIPTHHNNLAAAVSSCKSVFLVDFLAVDGKILPANDLLRWVFVLVYYQWLGGAACTGAGRSSDQSPNVFYILIRNGALGGEGRGEFSDGWVGKTDTAYQITQFSHKHTRHDPWLGPWIESPLEAFVPS